MSFFRRDNIVSRLATFVCLAFVFTSFPVLGSPSGTGEKIPTNYEIIEKIALEAIKELRGNMPGLAGEKLVFLSKEKGAGNIDIIFKNAMIKTMTNEGLRVAEDLVTTKEGKKAADYELSYQLIRFNLNYPDIHRSYWVGSKRVDRHAEIGVFSQLIDLSTGDIVWVGETQKKYEDVISYSLLERVEDPQYDFTRPPRKELRWNKLVEPVIVTGIVTGLVYLFFSNQTSND